MSVHVPAQFPRKESWSVEVVPFEEKVALLLLTAADGNRGLIDEAIQAVADEGLSALPDVLDYIKRKKGAALGPSCRASSAGWV